MTWRATTPRLDIDASLVSRELAALSPYRTEPPWQEQLQASGLAPTDVHLLAANENLLGPSPLAVEAAARALADAHRYPDTSALALRKRLAEIHQVIPERIVVGNGSNEIIELLVKTFVGPGQTVVTGWPSFVVYRLVAASHGREALVAPLRNDRYDLAALATLVDRRTKLVFIANPNNPTGTYVPKRFLSAFLERIPREVIVVLDEAYVEYVNAEDYPDSIQEFLRRERTVVLRTFSKVHGLAGLRIGYGVMDQRLAEYIHATRQPFNVNGVAQAAALAALDDVGHVQRSQQMVWEGRALYRDALEELGIEVTSSQTNFVCAKLPVSANAMAQHLAGQGVFVRSLDAYDLPNSIRVGIGPRATNGAAVAAIREALPLLR